MADVPDPVSTDDTLVIQFSTTDAFSSGVIRMITNCRFSHADLVVPEGLLGASGSPHAPVVQGNPNGVAVRPFDYEPFLIRQRAVVKTPKAAAIVARARSQLGKPFDNVGLHSLLHPPTDLNVWRDWRETAQWWCVELHAWAVEIEGFWPFEVLTPENRMTPPMLLALLNPYLDIALWHATKVEAP